MTEYELVSATYEHAAYIAMFMQEADAQEVWAMGHYTPAEAAYRSIEVSRDPLAGIADGRPFCIFGVGTATPFASVGVPWMLATDEIALHARPFLRGNRRYFAIIREEYAYLENYVDARHSQAIRWLRWMGFEVDPKPEPYGVEQLPFHKFCAGDASCA